jgi:hypothetical protein
MMRVLITVTPRMYRQAIALSMRRHRPDLDVRVAPPEATEGQLADFRPHLLLHNDNDGLGPEAVADVPCRIEVQYSDSMGARISADDQVYTARDMSMEEMLQVVDVAIALADRKADRG